MEGGEQELVDSNQISATMAHRTPHQTSTRELAGSGLCVFESVDGISVVSVIRIYFSPSRMNLYHARVAAQPATIIG